MERDDNIGKKRGREGERGGETGRERERRQKLHSRISKFCNLASDFPNVKA